MSGTAGRGRSGWEWLAQRKDKPPRETNENARKKIGRTGEILHGVDALLIERHPERAAERTSVRETASNDAVRKKKKKKKKKRKSGTESSRTHQHSGDSRAAGCRGADRGKEGVRKLSLTYCRRERSAAQAQSTCTSSSTSANASAASPAARSDMATGGRQSRQTEDADGGRWMKEERGKRDRGTEGQREE